MDTRRKTLMLTHMLSRAPKQEHALPLQRSCKHPLQKIEETNVSKVFTYTQEKAPSKEKVKYIVSQTVNRSMLVAIDLLKEQ